MTDEKSSPHGSPASAPPDADLNIKGVVAVGIGLALATGLAALVSWWLSLGLRDRLSAEDPPPPTLIEAQMPHRPPSPNLQIDPAGELAAMRVEEEVILGSYEWSDATETSARVPIERAMEMLLETRPEAAAFTDPAAPSAATGQAAEAPEEASDG